MYEEIYIFNFSFFEQLNQVLVDHGSNHSEDDSGGCFEGVGTIAQVTCASAGPCCLSTIEFHALEATSPARRLRES